MSALALVAALAITAPASAQASVRLVQRQALVLDDAGVTAAWAVDPEIVDAVVRLGRVTVTGRSAGATVLSVVGPSGVTTYQVVVDALRPKLAAAGASAPGQSWTSFQAGYDSSTSRATAGIDVVEQSGERLRRLHLSGVARSIEAESNEAPVSLPSLAFEASSPESELVIFDRFVENSPLTVNGVSLRGAHVRRGPLAVHAGYASSLLYDSLILPGHRELAAGVGYGIRRGPWTLTPNAFVFPSRGDAGGEQGAVGSVVLSRGAESDPFRMQTELGFGGRLGGAADVALDGQRGRLRVQARHQPRGFAALGLGAPRGTFAEAAGSVAAGRLFLNASGSLSRYALSFGTQRSDAGTLSARLALAGSWFLTGGASVGSFDANLGRVRALSVPAGVAFEGQSAGVSLLYRYQENTGTNHGGSGGRLGVRAGGSRLRGSAFVDAQREAPTVDFTLRQEPRLARLLAEQGLTAQTPEDLARILALYAPLSGQGYLDGVSVNANPWRIQGGADFSVALQRDGRQQLRLHFLLDRTRTVARQRETTLASVSYARYVAGAELSAGYTWARSDIDGWRDQGSSFQITLRRRFEGLPRLPWTGGGAITGLVFGDDAARGSYAKGMPALPGVRVRLDGTRYATSDAQGRFRFDDVGPGSHSVEAMLPSGLDTMFTTPSAALVGAGGAASFGLSRMPSRLVGFVRDDAGQALVGVVLRLSGDSNSADATTDSSGRFALVTVPGEYVAAIDGDSLPAGYDPRSLRAARVWLRPDDVPVLEFVVAAHRAVSGRVLGGCTSAGTPVRLLQTGRTAATGADGGYVFRNLRPGRYTLAVDEGGCSARREVEVPAGPTLLRDVDLDPSSIVSSNAERR